MLKNCSSTFASVATCDRSSADRDAGLAGYLAGEAFEFGYEEYVESAELAEAAEDYDNVKKAFIPRFRKPKPPEKKSQRAVSGSLDAADFSLFLMEWTLSYTELDLTVMKNLA